MAVVSFFCNANSSVGFGHLRRCLFLAESLRERGICEINFTGSFSGKAKTLIREEEPGGRFREGLPEERSNVIVIDYMFDHKNMGEYDISLIREVARRASETVLISSAARVPQNLPVDLVIGHLLGSDADANFELKAGLKYAPVAPEVENYRPSNLRIAEKLERIFVGFGNTEDSTGIVLALRGLRHFDYQDQVDLLLPPALVERADEFRHEVGGYSINIHHNIPSVPNLLGGADLMIGSYGHMTFESLALGVPTIVVGMKDFMVEYASRLDEQNVAMSAGHVDEIQPAELATIVDRLDRDERHSLSANSMSFVDGKGLQRVGQQIYRMVNG